MGELIHLDLETPIVFSDIKHMLNAWWKDQEQKPMVKPEKIRHVVTVAVNAGWTLDQCYEALSITWSFSEAAFEVTLRKLKSEAAIDYGDVGNRILYLAKGRDNEIDRT